MKALNRIAKDFKTLPHQDVFQLLLLIFVIFYGLNIYNKIYLDQTTPCKIVNSFIEIPLPSKEYMQIIPNNYGKLSVFSITCIIENTNNCYEKKLTNYLLDHNYKMYANKANDKHTVFRKKYLDLTIKKDSEYFSFSLDMPVKGVFDHE